ncbi:MAG: SCO family protein [Gammaproteobacteria bacterium]|nr:SCO family protein [Gammaproteobacteria bacterium]
MSQVMRPDEQTAQPERRGRGRIKLFLIIMVFFLPQIIAYLLYYGGWRSHSLVNHGQLIQPARPIGDVRLQSLDGKTFPFSALRGKWLMVYFGSSSCDSACVQDLYKMRQVRIAQGGNATRLRRLFVVTANRNLDHLHAILQYYPGMRVVVGPPAAVASLAGQFAIDGNLPDRLNRIYIVDPLGNLMMSYPPDADPEGIRKDLVRLLQVSQVG